MSPSKPKSVKDIEDQNESGYRRTLRARNSMIFIFLFPLDSLLTDQTHFIHDLYSECLSLGTSIYKVFDFVFILFVMAVF